MKTTVMSCAAVALFAASAAPLLAQSAGDWSLGVGVSWLNPKSGNGTLAGGQADVGTDIRPTITGEYFIANNIGIELLASWPFEHDITISGIGYAGSTKHLPPTLSLNYHVPTSGPLKPYFGIGVNYTRFFDEQSPLGVLELDNSFGLAVQAGLDYAVGSNGAVRANIRWIDIDTDVSLNGAPIGTAEIDPIIVTLGYVFNF